MFVDPARRPFFYRYMVRNDSVQSLLRSAHTCANGLQLLVAQTLIVDTGTGKNRKVTALFCAEHVIVNDAVNGDQFGRITRIFKPLHSAGHVNSK
jgi:hypothetical protein